MNSNPHNQYIGIINRLKGCIETYCRAQKEAEKKMVSIFLDWCLITIIVKIFMEIYLNFLWIIDPKVRNLQRFS